MKVFNELTRFRKCCFNFCRTWEETENGKWPESDHSPACPEYKRRHYFRITAKGDNGPSCILDSKSAVIDFVDGEPEEYDVKTVRITRDQYEKLSEFEGF